MGPNPNNIFVGAPDQLTTGAILSAPSTADHPQSVRDPLPPEALSSGYIDENGLKLTPTRTTEDIKDWDGATVRRILTEFDGTLAWNHLELSEESAKDYAGDGNVDFTPADLDRGNELAIRLNGDEMPVKARYFRMKDGPRRILIVAPRSQVTEQTELDFVKNNVVRLGVVASCYPDEFGNSIYIYTTDGVIAVTAPTPTVKKAEPEEAAEDDVVTITGYGFNGTTSVKFGATEATSFDVDSSTSITAVMPAGTAGDADIVVTAPGGTSEPFAYTRGA